MIQRNNTLVATTINETYIELAKNWVANLKRFDIPNVIVYCLDKNSFNSLKDIVHCECLGGEGLVANTRGEWIEVEKFYKHLLPFQYAKRNKCSVLFSDVDVVFLKDPLNFFIEKSVDADIVVTSDKRYDEYHLKRQDNRIITIDFNNIKDWGYTDQFKYGELNGSVALYKYSDYLECYFESFFNKDNLKHYPSGTESGAAQTAFNDFVKINKSIKIKKISVFDFANGSLLNVRYLKNKVLESACGIHYNFCENLEPRLSCDEKIRKIKEDGLWFI